MNSHVKHNSPGYARGLTVFLAFLLVFCLQVVRAAPTTPTSDFIDNKDGTVTHKITG